MSNALFHQQVQIQEGQRINMQWLGRLWVLLPIAAAITIGWLATASGPGVNADSVNYINMAANVQAGRGFIADFVAPDSELPYGPVTFWPPGFSLFVAGFIWFGLSAVEAARWVSLLSLGGIICATYLLGQNISTVPHNQRRIDSRMSGLLAAIAVACLMPMVRLGTFALSEAPFALFSMLVLLAAIRFVQSETAQEQRWLLLCTLWVALAIFTRYVGVIWLVGLAAAIVWKANVHATNWGRVLARIAGSSALAVAPLAPWLYRNWRLTGYLSGMDRDHKFHADLVGNLHFLAQTLVGDLLPSMHLGMRGWVSAIPTPLLIIMGLLVLGLATVGVRRVVRSELPGVTFVWNRGTIWHWLCTPKALTAQFCLLYLSAMLMLSTTMEFPLYDWPRTAAVIYPCLIALAVSLVVSLLNWGMGLRPMSRFSSVQMPILLATLALCLTPYALQTRGFVQAAAQGQEFTAPAWRNNQALRAIAPLLNEQSIVYSDRAPAVYLHLQRPVRYLPHREAAADFYQFLERKSPHLDGNEYVLTFKAGLGSNDPYRSSRMSYAEMMDLMTKTPGITLVADLPDGAIFRLDSRAD